jgi:endonuclease YncB( thermonuclease family)
MKRLLFCAALLALLTGAGCSSTKAARRYSKSEAAATLAKFERVGLVLGTFPIDGSACVLDGDTIRVKGLKSTMRLLAIDTEETFKHAKEREEYAHGWEWYLKEMRGDKPHPAKFPTPLGMDAMEWARDFFDGVKEVRLERDHPGEIRGFYNRYLVYVMVKKNGQWLNYNLEAVKAGMSPYFTKYGRSRRFDAEFRKAQADARAAKIGIWDPTKQHYVDYDERLKWWDHRGDVIQAFEKEANGRDGYISLTRWNSMAELEKHIGKEVHLFAAVQDVKLGDKGPTVVKLSRTRTSSINVVFFDKDVFLGTGLMNQVGEYVTIRGRVSLYHDRRRNRDQLQIVVSLPGQVIVPSDALDEALLDAPGAQYTDPAEPPPEPIHPGDAAPPAAGLNLDAN